MGSPNNRRLRGGIGNHVESFDDEADIGDKWGVEAAAAVAAEAEPEQPRPKARNTRVAREVVEELRNHSAAHVDDTLTDMPSLGSAFVNPVKARMEQRISVIARFIVAALVVVPIILGLVAKSDTVLYSGVAVLGLVFTAGKLLHGAIVRAMSVGLRLRLWVTCGLTLGAIVALVAAQVGTPIWGVAVTACLGYSLLKHMVNDVNDATADYRVVQVTEEIIEE